MASETSPLAPSAGPSNETAAATSAADTQFQTSPNPLVTPTAKPHLKTSPVPLYTPIVHTQPSASKEPLASSTPVSRPPQFRLPEPEIVVPSYSRWFSWDDISDCEVRYLPEFFDGKSPSRNPSTYRYYRNVIVRAFRENPGAKLTFTEVRKTLVGDVGSIRRVFDFLEEWGLINYAGVAVKQPLKWEEKEKKASQGGGGDAGGGSVETLATNRPDKERVCSSCKVPCSIACFSCQKIDLTLCARCFVRGNYQAPGVNTSDFRRVEISEDRKSNWSDAETLRLLEAIMHYGDDWKRVAQHVTGGRSEKDCVSRFIRLPFGEQFAGHLCGEANNILHQTSELHQTREQGHVNSGLQRIGQSSPTKRLRLTPLADASNPIMAQVAFLSALSGEEVAASAAKAAVKALSAQKHKARSQSPQPLTRESGRAGPGAAPGLETAKVDGAEDARSLPEKEKLEGAVKTISNIVEVQMKEIWEKIVHFEEFDLHMEKERQQLEQLKNLLFVDQLTLLFHRSAVPGVGQHAADICESAIADTKPVIQTL